MTRRPSASGALLIVNADDLGYAPEVSRGIVEALAFGVVTSATLLVNGPDAASAAELARGRAVGLHVNLARWAPLSAGYPEEWLAGGALDEAKAGQLSARLVKTEVEAQLARFEALMKAPPTHLDVHKHLHRHPAVLEGVCAVAAARSLPVRSIDAAMRAAVRRFGVRTNLHFVGDAGAEAYWTLPRLRALLPALPRDGVCELMCHPGYAPVQVRSGYSAQREVERATFLSQEAKDLVERLGPARGNWAAV